MALIVSFLVKNIPAESLQSVVLTNTTMTIAVSNLLVSSSKFTEDG
jgi:hypothetical protein